MINFKKFGKKEYKSLKNLMNINHYGVKVNFNKIVKKSLWKFIKKIRLPLNYTCFYDQQ